MDCADLALVKVRITAYISRIITLKKILIAICKKEINRQPYNGNMIKDHFKPIRATVFVVATIFGAANIIDFYRLTHSSNLSNLEIFVIVTVGFFYALYIPRFFLFLSLPTVSIDDELFFEIKDKGKFSTYLQVAHYGSFNIFEVRIYIDEVNAADNSFVKELMNKTISQLPSRKDSDYSKTKILIENYDHLHWRKTNNRMRVTVSFVTRLFNVKGFETKILHPEKNMGK